MPAPRLESEDESLGVDADPVEAFRAGGYAERLAEERGAAVVESAHERS